MDKLEPRGREMLFIGHAENTDQYLVCSPRPPYQRIKSRDICFLEDASPRVCTDDFLECPSKGQDQTEISQQNLTNVQITNPLRFPEKEMNNSEDDVPSSEIRSESSANFTQPPIVSSDNRSIAEEMGESSVSDNAQISVQHNSPQINSNASSSESGGVTVDEQEKLSNELREDEQSLAELLKPVQYSRFKRDSNGRLVRVESLAICSDEPNDQNLKFETVMATPEAELWFKAMKEEIQSLESMNTYTLVKPPPGALVITNTWVYKIKRRADNSIERYKARLVAHGFRQRPGFEYNETTAPVARISTIKVLLTIAHTLGMEVYQFDVTAAFLNGELDEVIYMAQPKGFVSMEHPDYVCKLNKALYGLKQAGHQWFLKLRSVLKSLQFIQSSCDCCVFLRTDPNDYVMLVIYVDDILIACKQPNTLKVIVDGLCQNFKITEKGPVNYFLGLEVGHDPSRGYWLSQEQYIKETLDEFGMLHCNSCQTPLVPREDIPGPSPDEVLVNSTEYRRKIGRLNYLANHTRPDIAHAVHKLAQFSNAASVRHDQHIKHILRYLKGTKSLKLWLNGSDDLSITAFTDASYATNADDSRSFTGVVVKLGNAVVDWNSVKQKTTANSTAASEYVAFSYGTNDILYFQQFMQEIGLSHLMTKRPVLYGDNTAAIANAQKFQSSRKLRHIKVAFNVTREAVHEGIIDVEHVSTHSMIADGLTKSLEAGPMKKMIQDLGLATID